MERSTTLDYSSRGRAGQSVGGRIAVYAIATLFVVPFGGLVLLVYAGLNRGSYVDMGLFERAAFYLAIIGGLASPLIGIALFVWALKSIKRSETVK